MAEERNLDVEKNGGVEEEKKKKKKTDLANNRVDSLAWEGINVSAAKLKNPIIADVNGLVRAGKIFFPSLSLYSYR